MPIRDFKLPLISASTIILLAGLPVYYLKWGGTGQPPAIKFAAIDGTAIDLKQLRDRPVIVNFWATSCGICRHEIPVLAALYNRLSSRNIEIIGVAMAYDPPDRVIQFTAERDIPYPVALDISGGTALAFGGVENTPTTFLITPDGNIDEKISGTIDANKLYNKIISMLPRH